jgi:protein-L-isoaspartate(D-aspartate) O-methyltransferase
MFNERNVNRMMADIEMEIEYTRRATGIKQFRPSVMNAMRSIPRHKFVPESLQDMAYNNGPLSIGHGQTISQPYIVALMTELLEPENDDIVLEVGTGSGYQSAVLAHLVKKVYSIEIVPELTEDAQHVFSSLKITNIESKCGDGYYGWPEHAPYDGIIVTAAAPYVPEPLVEQLKVGARLVIPVGRPYMHQELLLIEKTGVGQIQTTDILSVAFVPLTGKHEAN